MAERPILFSAPMVLALLAGTKTQTRRVIKPQPQTRPGMNCTRLVFLNRKGEPLLDEALEAPTPHTRNVFCPFGQPGDRLWVRESFRFPSSLDDESPAQIGERAIDAGYNAPWCPTQYEADNARTSTWSSFHTPPTDTVPGRLRASMHMPRWASRITLEITEVRVERLQSISEADAIAEGVEAEPFPGPWWQGYRRMDDGELIHQQSIGEQPPEWMVEPHRMRDLKHLDRSAVHEFRTLWWSINGADSWTANPWVWAVSFRLLAPNT